MNHCDTHLKINWECQKCLNKQVDVQAKIIERLHNQLDFACKEYPNFLKKYNEQLLPRSN